MEQCCDCEPAQAGPSSSSQYGPQQHHLPPHQNRLHSRIQQGLQGGLQLVAQAVQNNIPQAVSPWLGGREPFHDDSLSSSKRSAFAHELKRDGGLVLGNGDRDKLRALLGLAVVNIAALGGSAQSLLSPQVGQESRTKAPSPAQEFLEGVKGTRSYFLLC